MTTLRTRHAMRLAALGLALGLVAAACGDDSGSSSDTTAAATTAAATTAAATTAKPADTTAGATTTAKETSTTAAAEPKYEIAADRVSKCPAEATAQPADGAPIKVAFVGPQTGPLAGFGLIAKGLQPVID